MNQLVLQKAIKAKIIASMAATTPKPKTVPALDDDGRVTFEQSSDVVPLVVDGAPACMDEEVLDAIAVGVSQAVTDFLKTVTVKVTNVTVGGITPGPATAIGMGVGILE